MFGVVDRSGHPLEVHIEQAGDRPGCLGCGAHPVGEGPRRGGARGSALLRSSSPADVAQGALVVSRPGLPDDDLDVGDLASRRRVK